MERCELVLSDLGLVAVEVEQGVLRAVVVVVIVFINRLGLKTGYGVELLDLGSPQARQGTKHRTLDLRHLCVFNRIDERVLSLGGMLLQFSGGILLSERRNHLRWRL